MKHDFENMSLTEISRVTGIPRLTLSSRMGCGLTKTEAATMPRSKMAEKVRTPRDLTKKEVSEVSEDIVLSHIWLRRPIVCR